MIIRVVDGTEREIVVVQQANRDPSPCWLAWTQKPRSYGYGSTPIDAISDLLQILENYGDE